MRKWLFIGCLLLVLFMCTACGGDDGDGSSVENRARETGRQAAEHLQDNVEAAQALKRMSADRLQDMEASTEQQ